MTGGEPVRALGEGGTSVGWYREAKSLTLRGNRGTSRGGGEVDPDYRIKSCKHVHTTNKSN